MSKTEPVKVLNRILNRLCQIDRFGYFSLPVTEAEAPGYYSVIDRPMCFSMMREKIESRQYRTWASFLSDFNLMLRNALYFNDKKSFVYRVALLLNKEGNERLKEVDIEGRQAIYLLHPGGPAAAAEEEAKEFEEMLLPVPMNPFLVVPAQSPKAQRSPLDMDVDSEDLNDSIDGYSSFSGTESEDDLRGQGCPSVMKMQTSLNESIAEGVRFTHWKEPYPMDQKDSMVAEFDWSDEWSRMEWRCKWLQFRMKELESCLERCTETLKDDENDAIVCYRSQRDPLPYINTPLLPTIGPETDTSIDVEDSCHDDSYPGRVYLSLGVLAGETAKLTAMLTSRQRICHSRMFVSSRQKKAVPPRKKQPSTDLLESKRTRKDFEHALHHSDSFSASVNLDRPSKLNITVPCVIEIKNETSEQWEKAKRMLRQRLDQEPNATMPDEVMQALQLSADEGSSEEDILDEVYMTKHQQMELAERERHLCVLGGLDPKRRKLPKKRSMRSSHSFPTHRGPAKRGRGRNRGLQRPVGRPPGNRRSHSELLQSVQQQQQQQQQQWLTSLPMTSWPMPVQPLLQFPAYSACPTIPVPRASTADVTAPLPSTTTSI